jgi:hypothetical protein
MIKTSCLQILSVMMHIIVLDIKIEDMIQILVLINRGTQITQITTMHKHLHFAMRIVPQFTNISDFHKKSDRIHLFASPYIFTHHIDIILPIYGFEVDNVKFENLL